VTRRQAIAIAVGAVAVAAVLWQRSAREPQAAGASGPDAPGGSTDPTAPPGRAIRTAQAALPVPATAPYPVRGTAGVSTDDPLTAYRKANVYPPTSRPLSADQLDLLRPGLRHETLRPVDRGDGVNYLFTADRYFAIGDDTVTAILEVNRDGAPIAPAILQAYAAVVDPVTHQDRPIPIVFTPVDGRFASVFAPAKLGLARQSEIGLYVEFSYGTGTQRGHINFQYTPTRGIPARFTGGFSESIESGSLIIRAGVEVAVPGQYVIDANLFDAANQPVAWSRFKGPLAAGTRAADLVFFGKVILDGNAQAPFHIGQLRGARFAPGSDPDLEQMPPFTGTYTTEPYPADRFSDAEYDSAEKQRMIELLSQNRNHGGAAGPGK
jgi:hypothetical protein